MKKINKKIIIGIVLSLVLIGSFVLFFILKNSSTDSEYFDYDDNLKVNDNNFVIDSSVEEIHEYVYEDLSKVDLSSELNGEEIYVLLNGDSVDCDSEFVEVKDSVVEISFGGTYVFSGTLDEGQIFVNSEEKVKIIFNGVEISSEKDSPIFVEAAKEVVIVLADGTTNIVNDFSDYVDPDLNEDVGTAGIFSRDDLYISGTGKLIIQSENKNGIQSKDQLVVNSGEIEINAGKEAIKVKDYFIFENGVLNLVAGEDGIAVTEEEVEKGWIEINGGEIKINSVQDGISAKTYLIINGGEFDITTTSSGSTKSAKGIKSDYYIEINGGTFEINSKDDGLHSGNEIVINNGDLIISSGDDGIHADELIKINDGNIDITKSYEGIEGKNVYINDGEISVVSSDDGINIADSSSSSNSRGGMMGVLSDAALYVNGGYLYVNADGDGLDSNGDMYITGGTILVDGPTRSDNGALDCNGELIIDGGYLIAVGSSGMAESPDASSEQDYVLLTFSTLAAGTEISIEDSEGNELMDFTSAKTFSSVVFSSADLNEDETYTFYANSEALGTFTISQTTSSTGSSGGNPQPGGMTGHATNGQGGMRR